MSTVSEAKLAANRANAQLSTGPTSTAGKTKVSLNAVKTGLSGRTVLLPTEDIAAYQATVARFTTRWSPETDDERILVQALADNEWRAQRIRGLEFGIFATGEREFGGEFADEPDAATRRTLIQTEVFLVYGKQLLNLQSHDARLRRQRIEDEARLEKLQGTRRAAEAQRLLREGPQAAAVKPGSAPASASVGFEFANLRPATTAGSKKGSNVHPWLIGGGLPTISSEEPTDEELRAQIRAEIAKHYKRPA